MSTTTAKISWQMTKSAQLSYFDNLHYKGVYHRNGVGNNNTNFSDNLARTLNTKWPNVQQVKFTTPWRSSFVIDLAYAQAARRRSFRSAARGQQRRDLALRLGHQHVHRGVADLQFQPAQARSGAREHQLFRRRARHPRRDTASSSTASRRRSGPRRRCAPTTSTASPTWCVRYNVAIYEVSHGATTSSRCSRRAIASRAITSRTSGRRPASW